MSLGHVQRQVLLALSTGARTDRWVAAEVRVPLSQAWSTLTRLERLGLVDFVHNHDDEDHPIWFPTTGGWEWILEHTEGATS